MDNYLTALEPFLKFGNNFGFYPVDFKNDVRKGGLKFTCLGIVRSFTVLGILCGMIILIVKNHITFLSENQPFLGLLVWSWFLLFLYPVMVIQLGLHVRNTSNIHRFFKLMDEIDGKLRKLFIKIDHRQYRKVILRATILAVVTLFARLITSLTFEIVNSEHFKTKANMIVSEVCYGCFLFYETFFILQFIFVAYLLRERFNLLKDLLRYNMNFLTMLKPKKQKFRSRYENFSESFFNINLYGDVFHDICDSIESINILFTIHLIPILLSMLVVDVFGIYALFQNFPLMQSLFYNIMTLYYVSKHFILRVLVAHIGATATREPEKLIEMIAKLVNKLSSIHPLRHSLCDLMKQFQTRNLKLQAMFLTVNWNIVLGTISTTVTYLIIICQFQQSASI
ncbi:hypothetical protein ACKWTF_004555 [Chironomus riparius]